MHSPSSNNKADTVFNSFVAGGMQGENPQEAENIQDSDKTGTTDGRLEHLHSLSRLFKNVETRYDMTSPGI